VTIEQGFPIRIPRTTGGFDDCTRKAWTYDKKHKPLRQCCTTQIALRDKIYLNTSCGPTGIAHVVETNLVITQTTTAIYIFKNVRKIFFNAKTAVLDKFMLNQNLNILLWSWKSSLQHVNVHPLADVQARFDYFHDWEG